MAPLRRIAAFALTWTLIAAACDDRNPQASESSPPAAPSVESSETETPISTPTPSLEPVASALDRCPGAVATLEGGDLDRSGSLIGEVNGDGVTDEVRLIVDPGAEVGCQAWVTVTSEAGEGLAASIEEKDFVFGLDLPALERLVSLDNRAGDEILVRVQSGASTQFFVLFTAVDGEPARVQISRKGKEVPFIFASGGSVGHLDAADCMSDLLVVSRAVLKGDRYRVRRSFYSPGPVLRAERREHALVDGKGLNEFPEFAPTPLNSCVLP